MSRVVLVTGVAGGIGGAIADSFSKAGWRVVGTDIVAGSERDSVARYLSADLVEADAGERLIETVTSEEGSLDALVNNAATQLVKPIADTTAEEWDHVFAVNARAPFLLTGAARTALAAGGGGSIVNVASVHAVATSAGLSAYASSKGALVALTRGAALELAPEVRVNAVLPGATDTDMLRAGLSRADVELESAMAALKSRHPSQSLGQPAQIAEAVLYLADNERAAFVTGQTLVVDGGAMAALSTEA